MFELLTVAAAAIPRLELISGNFKP